MPIEVTPVPDPAPVVVEIPVLADRAPGLVVDTVSLAVDEEPVVAGPPVPVAVPPAALLAVLVAVLAPLFEWSDSAWLEQA